MREEGRWPLCFRWESCLVFMEKLFCSCVVLFISPHWVCQDPSFSLFYWLSCSVFTHAWFSVTATWFLHCQTWFRAGKISKELFLHCRFSQLEQVPILTSWSTPEFFMSCQLRFHHPSRCSRYQISALQLAVDVSYAAPQAHEIVNVALHREYSQSIIFIFSQGRKYLYHV
jgi:hypothetical protein